MYKECGFFYSPDRDNVGCYVRDLSMPKPLIKTMVILKMLLTIKKPLTIYHSYLVLIQTSLIKFI